MLSRASRSLRRVCSTLAGRAAGAGDGVQGTLRIAGAVRGPSPSERPAGDTSRKYVSVDHLGRAHAVGRRKRAVARVWVWESEDPDAPQVTVNGQSVSQFFGGHWDLRYAALSPFFKTQTAGLYSVMSTVRGGGRSGQAEALRLGIATALQGLNFDLRPTLKSAGFLTRDRRQRERKKPGQAGARKKFAWVKR